MNIKTAIVMEVAEQVGAHVLMIFCDRTINDKGTVCGAPLIEKVEQGIPFCWLCATDRRNAHNARTLLLKVTMAARGCVVSDYQEWRPTEHSDAADPASSWKHGAAL